MFAYQLTLFPKGRSVDNAENLVNRVSDNWECNFLTFGGNFPSSNITESPSWSSAPSKVKSRSSNTVVASWKKLVLRKCQLSSEKINTDTFTILKNCTQTLKSPYIEKIFFRYYRYLI